MKHKLFIVVSVACVAASVAGASLAVDLVRHVSNYQMATQQADEAIGKLQKQGDFMHVFERVAVALRPSVVAIATTREMEQMRGVHPFHDLLPGMDDDLLGGMPSGRQQHPRVHGIGSGVIVSADGYILTNNHVVEHSTDLKVYLCDDREFTAKVIGADERTDLAVIKIDAQDLRPAVLADSDKLKVGQWVAAFGAPFGLDQTVSSGIVSAKGRSNLHITDYEDFIQTDAAINPGNSGGPLVDLEGHVVGIDAAIVSGNGGSQGVGFAIASNLAHTIMDRLIHEGKVVRGWLGVSIQELTPDLARSFGDEGAHGILIGDTTASSPAERAGLKSGDVITQLDGVDVNGVASFRTTVADMRPGKHVKLAILRDGHVQTIDVEIGTAPEKLAEPAAPREPARSDLGLEMSDVNPRIADELGLDANTRGVVIVRIVPNSAAEDAGLRPGDLIVAVNREDVSNVNDAAQKMRAHAKDGVLLRIRRDGASSWVKLPPVV